MPAKDFDPRPRDDVYPSPEELRRAAIPRALNPEEMLGPDYPHPEEDAVSRAKLPAVSWPSADKDSPDYAHLEPQGREPVVGDKKFKLTAADMERLLKANAFEPKGPDGRFVIAIRGANLIDDEDDDNDGAVDGVDYLKLEETRPDHKNFRCTIGYYNPGTKKFSAFRASTVPNVHYVTNYYMHQNGLGGTTTGANMLPTGCYVFRVGPHSNGTVYPALRLTDSVDFSEDGKATVLRTKNDMTFKTDDLWDPAVTQDHVHCSYYMDQFDSAGCLTVQGTKGGDGPWGHFQAVLKRWKNNTRIDLVLLTGRDASIAAYLGTTGRADDSDYAERMLSRLRPGSTGDAVSRLQEKLGLKPSGYFGWGTKEALVAFQRKNALTSDGIWSPALEEKLAWNVFKPAVATPTPASTSQAPAVVASPTAPAATVATATPVIAPTAAKPETAPPPQSVTASPSPAMTTSTTPATSPTPNATPAAADPTSPQPSAEAPAVIASADTRAKPKLDQFNSIRTTPVAAATTGAAAVGAAGAAAAGVRAVSPGLGDVAQRTSPTPAAPPQSRLPPLSPAPIAPVRPATVVPPAAAAPSQPAPVRAPMQPLPPVAARAPSQPAAGSVRAATTRLELTPETLQAFAPDIVAQYRTALLEGNEVLTRYAINLTPLRFCHFLAQISSACGRMTVLEEHLGYRSAALVKAAWPTRFRTVASAEPYVNEPQRLADRVYGDRFDNQHGDGWRYRGRGLAQITGRTNYRAMGEKLGIPLEQHPELALDPKHALVIACETWAGLQLAGERDMNKLADANKLEALSYRMAGAYTEIEDRRSAFEQAWGIWASGDPPRRILDTDLLDRGDRAGRVDELNSRLKEFGLFAGITPEPPQHIFSGCTYRAVRVLQAETGLPETGVVGAETWGVLDKAVERGLVTRGSGAATAHDDTNHPRRNPLSRRFAELRFWSIGLAILALLFIVAHIFLLTHPSGNAVLWMPMLFGAAVFVAGLALWLAARPHPHWQVPSKRAVTRTLSRGRPTTFVAGDDEPVRIGTNL